LEVKKNLLTLGSKMFPGTPLSMVLVKCDVVRQDLLVWLNLQFASPASKSNVNDVKLELLPLGVTMT